MRVISADTDGYFGENVIFANNTYKKGAYYYFDSQFFANYKRKTSKLLREKLKGILHNFGIFPYIKIKFK